VRVWLAVAFLIILVLSAVTYARLPGHRTFEVFDTTPPTPYFHYTPTGVSRGRILIVHGLDASKTVPNLLSYTLAEAGFEVFSMDLPGHGDSVVPFATFTARDAVEQVLNRLGPETAALGHSLGGALLLDVANDRPIPKLVLFSPAPIPLENIKADRILVLEGQFDPGYIRAFASQIRNAASNVEVRDMRWTGHSGGLLKPPVIESVVDWLEGSRKTETLRKRFLLIAAMLISGLVAGIALLRALATAESKSIPPASGPASVVFYVVATVLATGILSIFPLFKWLRLYATDFFIGILFLTGILLLVRFGTSFNTSARNAYVAIAAMVFLMGVTYVAASELADVTLSGTRWWRFPVITLMGFPLFLADETLLRTGRSRLAAASLALTTRVLLGAIAVTAGLTVHRDSAFLLLLMHAVVLFWSVLWFLTGAVRRRTDAVSAALFAALVQGWVFSALFVTT